MNWKLILICLLLMGCTSENIRIGFSAPLSGPVAAYGDWALKGAQIAVDEINEQGGVNGKLLELLVEDDQCSAKQATTTITSLQARGVDQFIVFCSAAVPGAVSMTDSIILSSNSKSNVVMNASNVFNLEVSVNNEMKELAEYIGEGRIAILHMNNDLGFTYAEEFIKVFKGTVTIVESFNLWDTDFKVQLTKIKQMKPDAVLIAMTGGGTANILIQAKKLGLNTKYYGTSIAESPQLFNAGGLEDGLIYPYPFRSGLTQKSKAFESKYQAKHGNLPERFATNTYDAVYAMVKLREQCDDSACMIAKARTLSFEGATGPVIFGPDGQLIKQVYIKQAMNKKFILIE